MSSLLAQLVEHSFRTLPKCEKAWRRSSSPGEGKQFPLIRKLPSTIKNPSLWPKGISTRLRRNGLQVRVLVQRRIYIISHFHRAYDYSGPFRVLWVHMAWYKNCVENRLFYSPRKCNSISKLPSQNQIYSALLYGAFQTFQCSNISAKWFQMSSITFFDEWIFSPLDGVDESMYVVDVARQFRPSPRRQLPVQSMIEGDGQIEYWSRVCHLSPFPLSLPLTVSSVFHCGHVGEIYSFWPKQTNLHCERLHLFSVSFWSCTWWCMMW